jgi:hypothetical protein
MKQFQVMTGQFQQWVTKMTYDFITAEDYKSFEYYDNITKEQYYDKETAEAKTYSIWYNKELLLIWERYHEKGPIKMSIIYCFECGSQLIFQNSELLDIHTLKPRVSNL